MLRKQITKLLLALLILSCLMLVADSPYKANSIYGIARPHIFSVARWEVEHFFNKWSREIRDLYGGHDLSREERIELVEKYFGLQREIERLESRLKGAAAASTDGQRDLEARLASLRKEQARDENRVEDILEAQISGALADEGLTLRLIWKTGLVFPPVDFEFDTLPHVLVVSPRYEIRVIEKLPLEPKLSLEEIAEIEARVEGLGYSALVTTVSGVATYPSLVSQRASLESTLSLIAHEWFHQYLFFRPLGRHYGASYLMTTINETAASMAGSELASLVFDRYGGEETADGVEREPAFDFNRAMREIRLAVDRYLAQGEIEAAERFMEEQRQLLASHGYHIRRLNQAYFAFHGSYADSPTSISPIGGQLESLRQRSASLGEFVRAVAQISSYRDLEELLERDEGS